MRTLIERNGKHYLVSTVRIPDEWETMVFPAHENGSVIDYGELACKRYAYAEEAEQGHAMMVETFQP